MKESYFENDYIQLWIEDGIVYEVFKPNSKSLDLENAKIVVRDRLKVSNQVSRPLFVDLCNLLSADMDARKYMAKGEALHYLNATAILVKNQLSKLLAEIYIRINKPAIPTKFFSNKNEAIHWLEKYKYMN